MSISEELVFRTIFGPSPGFPPKLLYNPSNKLNPRSKMRGEKISDIEFPNSVKSINEIRMKSLNEVTASIVQSYLEYAGLIINTTMSKQGYSTTFKDIDDDLVIKPDELINLIDNVQRALVSADD
jgi:hypothetical protein